MIVIAVYISTWLFNITFYIYSVFINILTSILEIIVQIVITYHILLLSIVLDSLFINFMWEFVIVFVNKIIFVLIGYVIDDLW